ncbi:hypothetical protein [Fictibacillus gelatini]|uniref:hypothetical protein n=1 Tax=Fictibacillus gelatini TaxID=225985 RepID=UPI0004156D37|nr:hypothetical protein [Fictibacillus gelatini]
MSNSVAIKLNGEEFAMMDSLLILHDLREPLRNPWRTFLPGVQAVFTEHKRPAALVFIHEDLYETSRLPAS